MATFWATFGIIDNRARSGGTQPVMKGRGMLGLTPLTTGAGSQIVQRSGDWIAIEDGALTCRCDGAVWIMIAASPTASAGATFYLAANERLEFSVEIGDKIAVKNA